MLWRGSPHIQVHGRPQFFPTLLLELHAEQAAPHLSEGTTEVRYVERGLEQSWEFTAHETEVGLYPRDLRVPGPSPGLRLGHPD